MKVSVVIVNYNGKDFLKKILASIKSSKFKNYEAIVLDNASTDNSKDFLRKKYPNITIVENESNMGYSGINSAIKYCKGEYILFLNNDMEIEKNCIGLLVKVLEADDSVGMAAPKLVNYYNRNLISGGTWLSRAFYSGHVKWNKDAKDKVIPYLGIGLIRKTIVDTYGYLFDPDYFIYGEDVDLGLRVRLLGQKIMYVNNAIVYHMHAATAKQHFKSFETTYLMERNLLVSFIKSIPLSRFFLYLPYILLFRVLAMIKDISCFNFAGFFARIMALLWLFANFYKVLLKRKSTQMHRKASTRFLIEIFTEKYIYKKKFIV